MREIVVISGKGGTGKTSVCASLAHLAQNKVVCDLDVDAPDMHILLDPQVHTREAFVSGNEAVIDRDACRRCGICFEHCRFDAVKKDGDAYGFGPSRLRARRGPVRPLPHPGRGPHQQGGPQP